MQASPPLGTLDAASATSTRRRVAGSAHVSVAVAVSLVLVLLATLFAVVSDAALSWDGSHYLFRTLNDQSPFVPHERTINVPLHWAVLAVGHLTENAALLRATFGVAHVVFPLLSLVASWWVVRDHAPALLVWPAIGIGVALLPGIFNFSSEAIKTYVLFWPVLLAVLLGMRDIHAPLVAFILLLGFIAHPAAGALMLFVGAIALVVALTQRARWAVMLAWSLAMVLGAILRISLVRPGYESSELSIDKQIGYFEIAVWGLPLAALVLALLASLLVLFEGRATTYVGGRRPSPMRIGALVALAGAGVILVYWAAHGRMWTEAVYFRSFGLYMTGLWMALATADHLLYARSAALRVAQHGRDAVVLMAAVVFAATIGAQGAEFMRLTGELRDAMAESGAPCIPQSSLGRLTETAAGNYAVGPYAVVIQGRTPEHLVMADESCPTVRAGGPVRLVWWEEYQPGWFDLWPVQERIERSGE